MNIFGIPFCISYDYWLLVIDTYFSHLNLTNDTVFITYVLTNFIYIYCVIYFIKFCKYFITFFINYIKKKKVGE